MAFFKLFEMMFELKARYQYDYFMVAKFLDLLQLRLGLEFGSTRIERLRYAFSWPGCTWFHGNWLSAVAIGCIALRLRQVRGLYSNWFRMDYSPD